MQRKSEFLVFALLTYLITGFVIEGYMFATTRSPSGKPFSSGSHPLECIVVIGILVVFAVSYPIALLIGYPLFMVPYFGITYGLLYWFYKKSKTSH